MGARSQSGFVMDFDDDDLVTAPSEPSFEQARVAYLNLPKATREVERLRKYQGRGAGVQDDLKRNRYLMFYYEETLRNYFKKEKV